MSNSTHSSDVRNEPKAELHTDPFGLAFGGWDASHEDIVAAFGPLVSERETPDGVVRCYEGAFLEDHCELECVLEPTLKTMRIRGLDDTPEYLLDRWIPVLHSTFGQPENVARAEVKWADFDGTEITLSVLFSHHPSITFVRGCRP